MYISMVIFLFTIQNVYGGEGGWFLPSKCSYPWPSQRNFTAHYNDYFYGYTSLWTRRNKRAIVSTTRLRHSLLLFRGKIFEWGSKRYPWPRLGRPPSSCSIKWYFDKKGSTKCTLNEVIIWSERYVIKYGRYRLFSNNCHHYVNRLAYKLNMDCRTSDVQYVRKMPHMGEEASGELP